MTDSSSTPSSGAKASREERLAAKLRENLRRRKQQARSLQGEDEPKGDSAELPKPPGTR